MVTSPSADQAAPGALEQVRTLLNSWLIPNDTRQPVDKLGQLSRDRGWGVRAGASMRWLRDDLRLAVETRDSDGLNDWIARTDLRPRVTDAGIGYDHAPGPAGDLMAVVVGAISDGTWRRLKACPDCRWVFYDHTRNGSKRWCLMTAGGPDGRACGTIAKVRRYRERWAVSDDRPAGD